MPNDILTIGADPELVIVNPLNKQTLSAQAVFRPKTNPTSISTQFGYDGNANTLEIRPKPANDPITLANNIKQLLEEAKKEYPEVFRNSLYAHSQVNSIGGHIHLGHEKLKNSSNMKDLSALLDLFITIPLALVEAPEFHSFRVGRNSYGKLSDVREAPWGMEYRSPACWLSSKELTEAILCAAYQVSKFYIENGVFKPKAYEIVAPQDIKTLYNTGQGLGWFKLLMPAVEKDMLNMAGEYKSQIKYLYEAVKEGKILTNTEVKDGWKIEFIRISSNLLKNMGEVTKAIAHALMISNTNEGALYNYIRPGNDYRVGSIAESANSAIVNIFHNELLNSIKITPIKVYGIRRSGGDGFSLALPYNIGIGSVEKFRLLIKKLFGNDASLIFSSSFNDEIRLGLPRKYRELDNLSCETLVVALFLLVHNDLYKSKIQLRSGQTKSAPVTESNFYKPLTEVAKLPKMSVNSLSDLMDDEGNLDIQAMEKFIDAYIKPRLEGRTSLRVLSWVYDAMTLYIRACERAYSNSDNPENREKLNDLYVLQSHLTT